MSAPAGRSAPPAAAAGATPPAHSAGGHVRAAVVMIVLMIVLAGFLYPLLVTGIAEVLDPGAANGSLLRYPNGTVEGSSLVAQNLSAPFLFWERPSLSDYNMLNGTGTAPGPTDPALTQLINETLNYSRAYGAFSVNASIPLWYLAPSASGIDPDLVPEAVLIQIPRVANATNLSVGFLTDLVNDHITQPVLPWVGVPYVDVLKLDLALVAVTGRS
jgi:potassium-transporting ATPase KdpC subunit